MEKNSSLSAVLVALALTAPITAMQLSGFAGSLAEADLKQQAIEDRDDWKLHRRQYTDAVNICRQLRAQGRDIECPDINDRQAIRAFIKGRAGELLEQREEEKTHAAAPALTVDDLNAGDRGLLRRYQRIQTCPESLKDGKQPGFYELCVEFIKDTSRSRILENYQLGE